MLGAIIGDIAGSRFEFNNIKSKDFALFSDCCRFTDDTVMTVAIGKAVMESDSIDELKDKAVYYMQKIGRHYPNCGYGGNFANWMFSDHPMPYYSFGNGAAMRVSACGIAAHTLEEAIAMSNAVTEVSHDHPEGLKGAEATTVAIWMAKKGYTKKEIFDIINARYYKIDFKLDDIRKDYKFSEACQDTVPQALEAFFESNSYVDTIKNIISIGGDCDTTAAIAGAIAGQYYVIPSVLQEIAMEYLTPELKKIVLDFEKYLRVRAVLS